MGPNKERCANCYYWEIHGRGKDSIEGICRKKSPSPTVCVKGSEYELVLPTPKKDDWCGDFKPIGE